MGDGGFLGVDVAETQVLELLQSPDYGGVIRLGAGGARPHFDGERADDVERLGSLERLAAQGGRRRSYGAGNGGGRNLGRRKRRTQDQDGQKRAGGQRPPKENGTAHARAPLQAVAAMGSRFICRKVCFHSRRDSSRA